MAAHTTFLGLGSNQGNRAAHLQQAIHLLGEKIGTLLATSRLYRTAAWGKTDQADFYNQVVQFQTTLSSMALLQTVLAIEQEMGRTRRTKWAERSIDIDILFYDDQIVQQPSLTIPHPFIAQRNFVLVPLAEIAPNFVHPVLQTTIAELVAQSTDSGAVRTVDGGTVDGGRSC